MVSGNNTLFLRLAGPMQSWGTASRLQLRRTDAHPSKSGVMGLLLSAMGVSREDSPRHLETLNQLAMALRIDRPGDLEWDYHTVGAGIGIRSADGKIKNTASTHEPETLLSRRQYIYDASFLVALQGDVSLIAKCAQALDNPVWPPFLGRRCCIPSEPVKEAVAEHPDLVEALGSIPWRPERLPRSGDRPESIELDACLEHPPGEKAPNNAVLVHDVARGFGFYNHGPRWVVPRRLTVPVGEPLFTPPQPRPWTNPYGKQWPEQRQRRLDHDKGLCVFCKAPAVEVHHLDYEDVRNETLRSLCKLCHDACTILEYSGEAPRRVDPADPDNREAMLNQVQLLLEGRRLTRRRELLLEGRSGGREVV